MAPTIAAAAIGTMAVTMKARMGSSCPDHRRLTSAHVANPSALNSRRPTRAAPVVMAASEPGGADGAGDLTTQWMCLNYRPWVNSEEDAAKCLAYLRDKEGREFNLEKAKAVLESIKADHQKWKPQIPFELPKQYPGFLLILQRSSDKIA